MFFAHYYDKLLNSFFGKSVGGTLGMPYEGTTGELNLTYYDPVPEKMVGNDDLDLQVVWLECIRRYGLPIRSGILEEGWMTNIRSVWDEYGVAQRNLRHGLHAPLSGGFNNKFTAGYGAAIRTEIWAGLAPANPDLAVFFATQDASVDHSDDGVDATRFLAAFESMAYAEKDVERIFKKALKYVNPKGRFYAAMTDTKRWIDTSSDYRAVRRKIIEKYAGQNFTDVCVNIPFVMLGLFYGKGDFSRTVCIAVNCGYDTDCNGATTGAVFGLLYPNDIPEKWLNPIGKKLILSPFMVGMHPAQQLDEFCMQIASICQEVQEYYDTGVEITDFPIFQPKFGVHHKPWRSHDFYGETYDSRTSVVALEPIYVALHYPEEIAVDSGETAWYEVELIAVHDGIANIEAFMPFPWQVSVPKDTVQLKADVPTVVKLSVTAPDTAVQNYIEMLELTVRIEHSSQKCLVGIPVKKQWLTVSVQKAVAKHPSEISFDNGEVVSTANSYLSVPSGIHYYAIEFKSPANIGDAILVAEGNRKLRVWIDDELVSQTNGDWYVPASHRGPEGILNYRKRLALQAKWQRLVVEVADGKPGEFFIGFFKPYGHEWLEDIETRTAFFEEETNEKHSTCYGSVV